MRLKEQFKGKIEALLIIVCIHSKPVKRLGKLAEHKEKKDDGVDSGCSAASPLLLLPKMNRNRKRKRGGLMIQQHLHNRPRISFFFQAYFSLSASTSNWRLRISSFLARICRMRSSKSKESRPTHNPGYITTTTKSHTPFLLHMGHTHKLKKKNIVSDACYYVVVAREWFQK